jgi:hypothetical protein
MLATVGCFLLCSFQSAAHATVISTGQYLSAFDRQFALERIEAALLRDDVSRQLELLGVAPADAAIRAQSLSDQELMLLATRLDELPAGGDLLGVIGVVFVVLLILELVGVTDIFNRI